MARRARNEGSIRKRADGRYEVRVVDPATGFRRSIFAKSETEAVRSLKRAQRDIDQGFGLGDARLTVSKYVADWLTAVKPTLRQTTYERYESIARLHIVPNLGRVKLRDLTPAHLRKLYAHLQEDREGPRRPGRSKKPSGSLGPRTVGHVHRVLHTALGQAARDGLTPRNVAALVAPPKVPHREMVTLDESQVGRLLDKAEQGSDTGIFTLAVTTGMRLGELLGLRWSDVELDAGLLHVRRTLAKVVQGQPLYQEPKTPMSRRDITLSRAAVDALRNHRIRQNEGRLRAIGWEDHGLVFPDAVGRPRQGSIFNRNSWVPLRKAAALPASFRFHDLRHSAASLALASGVPPTIVSEMLGHASTAITLSIYAHAVPGSQKVAADAMDAMISRASRS